MTQRKIGWAALVLLLQATDLCAHRVFLNIGHGEGIAAELTDRGVWDDVAAQSDGLWAGPGWSGSLDDSQRATIAGHLTNKTAIVELPPYQKSDGSLNTWVENGTTRPLQLDWTIKSGAEVGFIFVYREPEALLTDPQFEDVVGRFSPEYSIVQHIRQWTAVNNYYERSVISARREDTKCFAFEFQVPETVAGKYQQVAEACIWAIDNGFTIFLLTPPVHPSHEDDLYIAGYREFAGFLHQAIGSSRMNSDHLVFVPSNYNYDKTLVKIAPETVERDGSVFNANTSAGAARMMIDFSFLNALYSFDGVTLQGWTDLTPSNANSGPGNWAISPPAFPSTSPQSGEGAVGQNIGSGGDQDSPHPTLWLRSPTFMLGESGDLSVWLSGGTGSGSLDGIAVGDVPANTTDPGFLGVALRNAVTDTFVLSRSKSSAGYEWEQVVFTSSELSKLDPNATYTLDLIDAAHGGWGWVAMDTVTIPVKQVPAVPVQTHRIDSGQNFTVDLTIEGKADWVSLAYASDRYGVDNRKAGGMGIEGFAQDKDLNASDDGPIGHVLSYSDGADPAVGTTSGIQFNTGSTFSHSPVTHTFTLRSRAVGLEHVFRVYFSAMRLSAGFASSLDGAEPVDPVSFSRGVNDGDSNDGSIAARNARYELRWIPVNLEQPVTVDLIWEDGPAGFDRGGLAGATLNVEGLALSYGDWVLAHGLSGPEAGRSADPDGDGLDNFGEYVFGGNPNRADAQAVLPRFGLVAGEEGKTVEFVFNRRTDNPALVYDLKESADLTAESWTSVGADFTVEVRPLGNNIERVTQRIPVDADKMFFRLEVTEP